MIKCARQPGLADAFEMFLGFEGDEFYLANWPVLEGLMFGDLYAYFPAAVRRPTAHASPTSPTTLTTPTYTHVGGGHPSHFHPSHLCSHPGTAHGKWFQHQVFGEE